MPRIAVARMRMRCIGKHSFGSVARHPPHVHGTMSLNGQRNIDLNQQTEARRIAANVATLPELLRKP
jgi:hypothetical protein